MNVTSPVMFWRTVKHWRIPLFLIILIFNIYNRFQTSSVAVYLFENRNGLLGKTHTWVCVSQTKSHMSNDGSLLHLLIHLGPTCPWHMYWHFFLSFHQYNCGCHKITCPRGMRENNHIIKSHLTTTNVFQWTNPMVWFQITLRCDSRQITLGGSRHHRTR